MSHCINRKVLRYPNKKNLAKTDIITAKNARTKLHLIIPFASPLSLRIEHGPDWRNFVIPKEHEIREAKKDFYKAM